MKKDSTAWAQLGGLKKQQADTYYQQYQQVQQAAQLEAPGSIFQLTGPLASKLGTNPVTEYYSKKNNAQLTPLYQNATTGYANSLAAFKQSAKFASRADLPNAELAIYSAAQLAGQSKDGLAALQRYVELEPNSPNIAQIQAACKQLGGSCVPKHKKK